MLSSTAHDPWLRRHLPRLARVAGLLPALAMTPIAAAAAAVPVKPTAAAPAGATLATP